MSYLVCGGIYNQQRRLVMQKLTVFNNVSIDGYFTDAQGEMNFAQNQVPDAEWDAFIAGNAQGKPTMLFGRVTYQMMESFWPTPAAMTQMPDVAESMNKSPKVVFSRTLKKADWNNTRLYKDDLAGHVRQLKEADGEGLIIFGSGTIVEQLAEAGLIDKYSLVITPVVLGKGRSMFEGLPEKQTLKLTGSRNFKNGNILLEYEKM
jgi:dihydrofolate reductase